MRNSLACRFAAVAAAALTPAAAHAITFVNALAIANGTDLSDYDDVANNRLGGFGSDLVYNAGTGLYYGLTDRGPGGGVLSYAPRIQAFRLTTDAATGAIGGFQLQDTIVFHRPTGETFNGLNPRALNGDAGVLGNSLDSEGMVQLANGNFLISDEYGPSVYEFTGDGTFVRAFRTPDNVLPRDANGNLNFVDDRGTIKSGRQDNRGFESLTLSADGTKAYAMLQDPLVEEGQNLNGGTNAEGRFSRNLRIVEFDVASGEPERQFIYQLDPLAQINALGDPDFSPNQQGRSIGISAIQSLGDGKFLVLERDNRGVGTETSPTDTPLLKRAYVIDLAGATDVANRSLAGTNELGDIVPVTKESLPLVDLVAELRARGLPIPEKIEGMAFGEFLADGGRTLLFITDNDYSVTQNGGTVQFDVCFTPDFGSSTQVPIGAGCPTGTELLPSYLYSFKLSRDEYRDLVGLPAVPEPATWALMIGGVGAVGGAMRRRKAAIATA